MITLGQLINYHMNHQRFLIGHAREISKNWGIEASGPYCMCTGIDQDRDQDQGLRTVTTSTRPVIQFSK